MNTIFVDASALVSMVTREADDAALVRLLGQHARRLYSPVAHWEAATAIARKRTVTTEEASAELSRFIADFDIRLVTIGAAEMEPAVAAWQEFGKKSGHPAQLNMGDCFAYACAKTNNARLLYKGDDFAQTDLKDETLG